MLCSLYEAIFSTSQYPEGRQVPKRDTNFHTRKIITGKISTEYSVQEKMVQRKMKLWKFGNMKKSFMENLFKEKSFLEKSKVENWLQKFYYREISLHEKFGYMRNFVT